jgi:hypothetical protein
MAETREDVLGKGEAKRSCRDEEENCRAGHQIFVMGQWSLVIAMKNQNWKMTNDQSLLL